MEKLRYSIKTAGEYLNLTVYEIQRRARQLGIPMKRGLTAADVKRIAAYEFKPGLGKARATINDLKKEMEAMSHE